MSPVADQPILAADDLKAGPAPTVSEVVMARKRPAAEAGLPIEQVDPAATVAKRKQPIVACEVQDSAELSQLVPEVEDGALILRPPHGPQVFAGLGARLRAGHLVSFPTETVYGLGANGLDAKAVLNIFEAKGRPLTDPCILHVAEADDALPLLDLSDWERGVFDALTAACWPGPLSIVARARPIVPRQVTASTDFVAVRCPNHPVALDLIRAAGVPLAAPSANRFGHISPTLPEHVFEDLSHWRGLRILDGGACGVGIESTVLKLDPESRRVLVLRKGGVTPARLESVLAAGDLGPVPVECPERAKVCAKASAERDSKPQEAPGMMLKHYAPALPTFLLSEAASSPSEGALGSEPLGHPLDRSILIDFGGQMRQHQHRFLHMFELSSQGSSKSSVEEACSRAFATLREAETFALSHRASAICIADFDAPSMGGIAEALHDRMFRAASGRRAAIQFCADGDPQLYHGE